MRLRVRLRNLVPSLAVMLAAVAAVSAAAPVQSGDLVAVCGDSITEQKKYSVFIEDYLLMCQPVTDTRIMQFGWSGDTAAGFVGNKLDNDVLRFKPNVVTTCFGMNDGGYGPLNKATADNYTKATQQMIDKLKAAGVRTIIVGSPGCVDSVTFRNNPELAAIYNKTLASLGAIDQELATKSGVLFADVHTPMMDAMAKAKEKYGPKYDLAGGDGVHPNQNGHLVMAYAFLKAMGFSGDVGTYTIDLAAGKIATTAGHKALADTLKDGVAEIESSKYPFCFFGNPASAQATTGVIEFIPFNQDLNRLTLVVKNAPEGKYKITWGTASKQYAAADLAKGINLAAEFLDNPFVAQFEKVHKAVNAQQEFETGFIKNCVWNIPQMKAYAEDADKAVLDRIAESGAKKDLGLFTAAKALVTPVKHTLKIEAVK